MRTGLHQEERGSPSDVCRRGMKELSNAKYTRCIILARSSAHIGGLQRRKQRKQYDRSLQRLCARRKPEQHDGARIIVHDLFHRDDYGHDHLADDRYGSNRNDGEFKRRGRYPI
jgi:hypothetical protein